jgi:carboxypeptidase Taq
VLPILQAAFPESLGGADAAGYFRAINKVEPSFIRVEADEVTYNLHVALRFELECALLTGELKVKDLPEAWNAKMTDYLGICPPDPASGVLQDVHWSAGLIGYFPTYSIGNLISAQLWSTAASALPCLEEQIEHGEFAPLLDWLHANVHAYGCKYLPHELVEKTTGAPLSASHYVDYLTLKYNGIYGL